MIFSRLTLYLALACALLLSACVLLYHLWGTADERADRAEGILERQKVISRVVKEYVHDIQYLPVPDDVIARRVRGLCDNRLRADRPRTDGSPPADPYSRLDGDFARDLKAAWANSRQLAAVQAAARAAGCAE